MASIFVLVVLFVIPCELLEVRRLNRNLVDELMPDMSDGVREPLRTS